MNLDFCIQFLVCLFVPFLNLPFVRGVNIEVQYFILWISLWSAKELHDFQNLSTLKEIVYNYKYICCSFTFVFAFYAVFISLEI